MRARIQARALPSSSASTVRDNRHPARVTRGIYTFSTLSREWGRKDGSSEVEHQRTWGITRRERARQVTGGISGHNTSDSVI